MQRVIKFRARFKDGSGWVYWEAKSAFYSDESETRAEEIDFYTIGQFTGLLDKAGDEIYEGDIVKYWRFVEVPVDAGNYAVEWKDGIFDVPGSGTFVHKRNEPELEVIGNIYENPELLK